MKSNLFKRVVTLSMALVLLLTLGISSAFATSVVYDKDDGDFDGDTKIENTDLRPELKITKTLRTPEGTVIQRDTTDQLTFNFKFTYDGMTDNPDDLKYVTGENIENDPFAMNHMDWSKITNLDKTGGDPLGLDVSTDGKVTFDNADTKTVDGSTATDPVTNDITHIDEYTKETADLLAAVLTGKAAGTTVADVSGIFTKPGYYFWTVTENDDQAGANPSTAPDFTNKGESMDYSKAEYKIAMSVFTNPDTGKLEVKHVAYMQTKDDEGTAITQTDLKKTETLEFNNVYMVQEIADIASDPFDFTNVTNAKNLWIGKEVTGTLGDQTIFFPIEVTVKHPTITTNKYDNDYTHKGYILVNDGTGWKHLTTTEMQLTDAQANINANVQAEATTNNLYIELADATMTVVNLRHNMILVLDDFAVGGFFQAKEQNTNATQTGWSDLKYDVTTKVTENNVTTTLQTPNDGTDSTEKIAGDKANSVVYTNQKDATVLTGVTVDNLPFFAMLVLAAGAMILLVALKTRKARKEA